MTTLYVVMVEEGEYSDREVWVGGIYEDRQTAEQAILENSARVRQARIDYDDWYRRREAAFQAASLIDRSFLEWAINSKPMHEKAKEVEAQLGPRPVADDCRGERFHIVEVPLNQWGTFVDCKELNQYGQIGEVLDE